MFGNIYDSRYKSTQGIQMTFKHEIKDSKENYPGPGAYERYGDFYKYNDRTLNNLNTSIYRKKSRKSSFKTPEKERKSDDLNKSKNNENKSDNENEKSKENLNNEETKE